MTYTSFLVTVDNVSGEEIATTTAGVTVPSTAADTTSYQFVLLELDTSNNLIKGTKADGTVIVFAAGAELTLTIQEPSSSASA